MTRIYQGRVTKVEILKKERKGKASRVWELLPNGQEALWRHHEVFQDAVSYYTLALAAMAEGMSTITSTNCPEEKALLSWRNQVRDSWVIAKRRATKFDGPHRRVAKLLGIDPDKGGFDECAVQLLKHTPSSPEQRSKALLQLLKGKKALNQLCGEKIPFLCSAKGKLDATPDSVSKKQDLQMLESIRLVHEAESNRLIETAEKLNIKSFMTQAPKNDLTGEMAVREALHQWNLAAKKARELNDCKDDFEACIRRLGEDLSVPKAGRKPKGAYPFALVFKLFPTQRTWEVLRDKTSGNYSLKGTDGSQKDVRDFLYEVRTAQDLPVFDYFSNVAFVLDSQNKTRAVWFEFDLAAFIEAVKSPRRYLQDTVEREKEAKSLRGQIKAMDGRGERTNHKQDEADEGVGEIGFEGDSRVNLLRELVEDTLGYVAEDEQPEGGGKKAEYTIHERTLRGYPKILEKWRNLAEKNEVSEEELLRILEKQQEEHPEDYGSKALYCELAKPKFQPIWRDSGTKKWHAENLLEAWRIYKELGRELEDKERPIRFTPAHPEHSPRYFIIPKSGRLKSQHECGAMAFCAGIIIEKNGKYELAVVRISYSSPRLQRDGLRSDKEVNLESVSWLQPMMKALGLPEPDNIDFAKCRIVLQPSDPENIQLIFPVEVKVDRLKEEVGKELCWANQFNLHPEGKTFYNATLRWPHEKQPKRKKEKQLRPWFDSHNCFSCVAVDLGQRDAGGFARLVVSSSKDDFGARPSRSVGETNGKQWRVALERAGLFRLPGEDAKVWRERSRRDDRGLKDSGKLFDFRQELWGERGRLARDWEADETAEWMRLLEVPTDDKDRTLLSEGWRKLLTFPEQNDKLLIAMRRYQSRIAKIHRWCWFLKCGAEKEKNARKEIQGCDDEGLATAELKAKIERCDPRAQVELEAQLDKRLKLASALLVRIANRILPLRGRSWHWTKHPDSREKNTLHHLTQEGKSLDSADKPIWLRGQRGLSMERIEQIEKLRERFQSLNQMIRREVGGKPPIRRDELVPDPCPDLLEKIGNIKEQRVNQTAHMILAEALGLRLASPPEDKKALRRQKDQHGTYDKILDRNGRWIKPADFIVIEDLSRYRASQGRPPRENSRLMKWCHRAVRDKIKQLCEVFGLPVLEAPAAYSSRFCSRSGVAGFRAVEVSPGFESEYPWVQIKERKKDGSFTEEARKTQDLMKRVEEANCGRDGILKKHRTLLAPLAGGPIFVPLVSEVKNAEIQPAIAQADINAAINLGLRAIADPRLWNIHPRLRTKLAKGQAGGLLTNEKRKYGEKSKKVSYLPGFEPSRRDSRSPNFFFDVSGCVEWGKAEISDAEETVRVVSGKALWDTVNKQAWKRVDVINDARLESWKDESTRKKNPDF